MKKFFSTMMMALAAVAMISCGGDEEPVTPTPGGGEEDKTDKTTLAAPAPQASNLTETSADVQWAAVANAGSYVFQVNGTEKTTLGTTVKVEGLTAGTEYTFKVKAVPSDTEKYAESAWGEVKFTTNAKQDTPTPGPGTGDGDDVPASLQGSEYALISLGVGTQEAYLPASKIVADWRPNDVDNFLYVWENGACYSGGQSAGPNSYGIVEGWTALVTGTIGWAGAGWFAGSVESLNAVLPRITSEEGWYFHFATKSPEGDKGKHELCFYPTAGGEVKFTFGKTGSGCDYEYEYDGEWYEFEVPVSTLVGKGLLYEGNYTAGQNVMAVLDLQSIQGAYLPYVELHLDAMFFYKK